MDSDLQNLLDQADALIAEARAQDNRRARAAEAKKQRDLIHKDYSRPQPAQQARDNTAAWNAFIDARINLRWNECLRGYVVDAVNSGVEGAVEVVAEETTKALVAECKCLRGEIAALRNELLDEMTLRADAAKFDRAARGEVVDLPRLRLRGSA